MANVTSLKLMFPPNKLRSKFIFIVFIIVINKMTDREFDIHTKAHKMAFISRKVCGQLGFCCQHSVVALKSECPGFKHSSSCNKPIIGIYSSKVLTLFYNRDNTVWLGAFSISSGGKNGGLGIARRSETKAR